MAEKITCPLGSQCVTSDTAGNVTERCAWHVKMKGVDPAGTEYDDWACAMAWMPIMQLEVAQQTRGAKASVESLRNEQVSGHQQFMKLVHDRSK